MLFHLQKAMKMLDGTFAQDIQSIIPPIGNRHGLFISNLEAASNPHTLKSLNIEAVITLARGHNLDQKLPQHIEYLYIPALDSQQYDLAQYFRTCIDFIKTEIKRTNVLVHCMAGVSRSASVIIAYIMESEHVRFDTAFQIVKKKRKIISPNEGFIEQLRNFERRIHSKQKQNKIEFNSRTQQNNPIFSKTMTLKSNKSELLESKSTNTSWFDKTNKQKFIRKQFEPQRILQILPDQKYDQMLQQKIHSIFRLKRSKVQAIR